MSKKISPIIKAIYVSFLCGIFLILFGIPCLRQYYEDRSVVEVSWEIMEEPIKVPNIVICSTESLRFGNRYKECEGLRGEEMIRCMYFNTLELDKTILKLRYSGRDLEPTQHFEVEMTPLGQCHIIEENATIGTDIFNPILMNLYPNSSFVIYLGDRRLHFYSNDPEAVPGIRIPSFPTEPDEQKVYSLKMVKNVKRNTAKNPCNANPEYKFTKCWQSALEDKSECSLPSLKRGKEAKACTSYTKIFDFLKIWRKIMKMPRKEFIRQLGCELPCEYLDYQTVETTTVVFWPNMENKTIIGFSLASKQVEVRTEVQLYKLTNLVGDFGGSLGLFLGLSFLALWDLLLFVIQWTKSVFKSEK